VEDIARLFILTETVAASLYQSKCLVI
jgi:hypothetical protein